MTEDAAVAATEDDAAAEQATEVDDAAEPIEANDTTSDPDAPATPEQGRQRGGFGMRLGVAFAAVAFVGAAAFAAGAAQPYLVDRAEVATKLEIARTAARAIHTLWNYTPETIDTLPERASSYLSGDLEVQYRKFIEAIAPGNKQTQVTDDTEIVGAAVESLEGPEATVLVYTNTTATSALGKSIPQRQYLTYRLYMKRDQNRWVITKMSALTSQDISRFLPG